MCSRTGPDEKSTSHYPLDRVKAAFAQGRFRTTQRVRRHMWSHGWDDSDVGRCVADLTERDFHKSQAHLDEPGVWLDIYRPRRHDGRMYVKFMQWGDDPFLVLSFCVDGEKH